MQKCIATWYRILKGYQIKCWNEDNLDLSHPYIQDCLNHGKYAFAADFIRFSILSEHGGIYLDTDMEIIKDFDDILDIKSFIGYEDVARNRPSAGVIGSVPRSDLVAKVSEYYSFLSRNDSTIVCDVMRAIIDKGVSQLTIFPEHVFYPFNPYSSSPWKKGETLMASDIKNDTRAIHHWLKSWG